MTKKAPIQFEDLSPEVRKRLAATLDLPTTRPPRSWSKDKTRTHALKVNKV